MGYFELTNDDGIKYRSCYYSVSENLHIRTSFSAELETLSFL